MPAASRTLLPGNADDIHTRAVTKWRNAMTDARTNPLDAIAPDERNSRPAALPSGIGQVVLVLQGGGALGAYQVGVYQALHEAGIEPDWVIGTSIGAINASLIAGNDARGPHCRGSRNSGAASSMARCTGCSAPAAVRRHGRQHAHHGGRHPIFFQPNPMAFPGPHVPLGRGRRRLLFDTAPLEATLSDLVDFDRINRKRPRG